MSAEAQRARTEVVRNALVAPYLDSALGRRLFHGDAAMRAQIESTVRVVIEADRMFAEWGEPDAFRDRFVHGMADRIRTQLAGAANLQAWATLGAAARVAELARLRALDTPPEGV